jgi:glutaconyl-CoA/methylmalonyl-CoA decarboxylase subunit gamma
MKYIVTIADKSYEVEIEDIYARPVIARVAGQEFKVTPENEVAPASQKEPTKFTFKTAEQSQQPVNPGLSSDELTAPLPGTVIEIFVKAGEQIEMGQVILVIEAMKMKNSIRSTRAGKITEVLVSTGQTVAHKQALVRFG